MITLIISIIFAVFAILCLCALFHEDTVSALIAFFIFGLFFAVFFLFPTQETKITYSNEINKYFQITPFENGYLVVNLNQNKVVKEFDVRMIDAIKNQQVYVKITEYFNRLGWDNGTSISLEK